MYVEGFVTPVPVENKEAYIKHLREAAPIIKECGVVRMVEAWGDDVPEGKFTDFYKAVNAKENEAVLFSWFEWPSKEAREEGIKKMANDPRLKNLTMPFDKTRVIYGAFQPIFDETFGS